MRSGLDAVETMSAEEVRDTIVMPRLSAQLRWAAEHSPYWRDAFASWGVTPAGVRDLETFRNLPLTDKPQLLEDQCEHPPFGRLLAVPQRDLRRVHRTSGSTGTPFLVLLTARDVETTSTVGARALRCAGVRADDLVIHCLNYSMWSGGVTDHLCFEAAGATVIPYGVGNSSYLISTIRRLQPSAISCTPSYLFRLDELCTTELGVSPASLGLTSAFLGGEGGLQEPVYRAAIEERWQIRAVDANYGMSDVLSIFGSECEERRGLHFHGQGALYPELLDPSGETVDIESGRAGELVLTCLVREGQPLFRYRTHDYVAIVDTSCPCGRTGFLFKVLGRTDDMIVAKGINFFPSSVQPIIDAHGAALNGEYRIIVSDAGVQRLVLRAEYRRDATPEPNLADRIAREIRSTLDVTMPVELVPPNTFPRSDGKSSRIMRA